MAARLREFQMKKQQRPALYFRFMCTNPIKKKKEKRFANRALRAREISEFSLFFEHASYKTHTHTNKWFFFLNLFFKRAKRKPKTAPRQKASICHRVLYDLSHRAISSDDKHRRRRHPIPVLPVYLFFSYYLFSFVVSSTELPTEPPYDGPRPRRRVAAAANSRDEKVICAR